MRSSILVATAVLAAAGCTTRSAELGTSPVGQPAHATLRSQRGDSVGALRFEPMTAGLRITGRIRGLSAGVHGIHIHAIGRCDGDFSSAGSHFNPRNRRHGLSNRSGAHAGDMPNLVVGAGETVLDLVAPLATLDSSATGVFDADASAIVVHAAPDDQRTDPSGNSGERIACGVIMRR